MKKYIFPVIFSLSIGVMMAYFIISQYENYDNITVSKSASKVFFIQIGAYSNIDNMKNSSKEFTNYIYNVEDNMYYVYIGISLKKDNASKIKDYYQKLGYDTYIKEKIIDNQKFVKILFEYDNLLSKTEDGETIKVICNQILSKYEEYVNGKRKN